MMLHAATIVTQTRFVDKKMGANWTYMSLFFEPEPVPKKI